MRGAIPPLPQYVLMAWCLVKHRDNFTFNIAYTVTSSTTTENELERIRNKGTKESGLF
jgi:hypothetical protein